MAIIRCKMCGGDVEISPDKTFGTCEFCGNTMTFPKVDDDQRAAAFNRGNHFRRIGEFDKALAVYERIVREDDTDAEAHWCCALCRFGIEYVEDPATYEWMPTCHRASFDSFLEDVDYLAAVEHSEGITRRQYQKDAAKIAEVQRGILATSQNAEPYDVFICYKEGDGNGERTRDSLLAQDIYYQLTEQGRKVFFARITLEDVVGTQYEPYIFAALNSAKVMIVVGTKPEYLNAVWVKNEWSRFLALMKKDRNKLLLPCYRDMDPYDLPEQLSVLQSYDMGKIGFIQDLIRGIAKVLDADKKPVEPAKETVVAQQPVAPLLKRVFMFLEDDDWNSANEYCEKVLDIDPENASAYLGKLMAELHVNKQERLADQAEPFDNNSNYKKILRFGDEEIKGLLHQYLQNIKKLESLHRLEKEKARRLAEMQEYEQAHRSEINEFKENAEIVDGKLIKYTGAQSQIYIPCNITAIGAEAFKSVCVITDIVIPNSVTSIGEWAFQWCKSLVSVTISDSVTSIGAGAFSSCSGLKQILISSGNKNFRVLNGCLIDINAGSVVAGFGNAVIPDDCGVTSIGEWAFYSNESLTSVIIPDGVTSIGKKAFSWCKSLTSVTIPDSVTSIGEDAFCQCESLTSVAIPDSVTDIGAGAFSACNSLKQILISSGNKNFRVLNGCLIDVNAGRVISGFGNAVIPDDGCVISIGGGAFYSNKSLTSVTIPDGVTSIGEGAFDSCKSLESITIPNSVTSIGAGAFCLCGSLTSVTIPDGVTNIGEWAFQWCKSLVSVTIPDSVTSIGAGAFSSCSGLKQILVSSGNKNFRVLNGCLIDINAGSVVSGFGDAVIPDNGGVISIGEGAFYCNESLTSVTIPDGVTNIGESAFEGCESLAFIIIPDSVISIGDDAVDAHTTICASKNSYAAKWAEKNSISWVTPEAYRIAETERIDKERRNAGLCRYCGGVFKGLFLKKCTSCGKPKDY